MENLYLLQKTFKKVLTLHKVSTEEKVKQIFELASRLSNDEIGIYIEFHVLVVPNKIKIKYREYGQVRT